MTSAKSRSELALAGFSAGLGMWTKNEGALYAACLGIAWIWRTRDLRGAVAFAVGTLPCAALLAWFKLGLAPPNDLTAFSTRATIVENALDWRRWAELLVLTVRRVVYFQDFGLWGLAAGRLLRVLRKRPGSLLPTAGPRAPA